MKRIILYNIYILTAILCSVLPSHALTAEYTINWNAGSCNVEIAAAEGESGYAVGSAISAYISSNSISWLTLDYVESGSTSELWELCFSVANNTGGSSRSADFTPWGFRIVQAAQGASGPTVTAPTGGVATVYPGAAVSVTVDNLTASARVALRRKPLSGGVWTVLDSLSLTAPSCSFSLVLEDGEYEFSPLGIGFSVTYPDIMYYRYSVSGLYSNTTIDCDGERKTGYITGYTDAGGVSHSVDSALAGQLQQLFNWYNSGSVGGWDAGLQLSANLSSGRVVITAVAPPNFGAGKSWDTGLHLSASSCIAFSQAAGGDLMQKACSVNSTRAQISSSQVGVTYTVTDGEHAINATGTGSSLSIYLSGSGISGAYSVYASYGGRTRLMKSYVPDNDLPPADGTLEGAGPNSVRTTTTNGAAGSAVDVVYYDGLGLKKQEVAVRASGDGLQDIVRPVRLDHLGREWRSYLPYADSGTAGAYRGDAFNEQALWWYNQGGCDEGAEYAYSSNVMEASAVGRTLTEKLPGEAYHDESHDTDYSYTGGTLRRLAVNSSGVLSCSGFYTQGAVSCTSVTDGDGHVRLSYTDREGRMLAEGPSGGLAYYAYDPCGRLAWMVSPEGASRLTNGSSFGPDSDFAADFCFVYTYDSRGRMTGKRLPGASTQYFVYDSGDRLVFFQDGNMREDGQWKALFYDTCGRLVREDLRSADSSVTGASLQAGFDASLVPSLYTATSGVTPLRTYVYDSYPAGMDSRLSFQSDTVAVPSALRPSPKGLQVYEDIAILGSSQTAGRARYYDREDRVIQEVTLFPDGTVLRTSSSYDIQGRLLGCISKYQDAGAETGKTARLTDTYQYDARGRVSGQQSSLVVDNLSSESCVAYSYDDLGRPWKTFYGPELSRVATQQLSYTKQGWESGRTVRGASNNILFSSALHYESPLSDYGYTGAGGSVSWAGRISSWEWQQAGRPLKAYEFEYDQSSRLTSSTGYSGGAIDYNVSEGFGYDLNSNITSRTYYGSGGTPNVSNISRSGNQRHDYYYDDNGNVTCVSDIEDEWSRVVSYNILNLPAVSVERDMDTDCLYLADGTKRSVINTFGSDGNIYAGPFRYRIVHGDRALADCAAAGGRFLCLNPTVDADYDDPEIHAQYFISDYLDNTRAIFDANEGNLVAKLDYAPFGRIVWNSGVDVNNNSYLWTGKELHNQLFDSVSYDSSARFLFTDGSFTSIDPLAEKYPGVSPYAYCAGDPVNKIDPDGNIWETAIDVASLAAGIKSFVSNVKEGNVGGAIVDGIGIVFDAAAVITPLVPGVAGASIKALRAVDKGADALKAADKVVDTTHGLKNANRIQEGKAFEKEMVDLARKSGEKVETQVRLIPNNGKGNVAGNRSTVDQLILNGDGTFTVVETKLSPNCHLSSGQKAVRYQVTEGNGSMIVRSDKGIVRKNDAINVSNFVVKYKYGE